MDNSNWYQAAQEWLDENPYTPKDERDKIKLTLDWVNYNFSDLINSNKSEDDWTAWSLDEMLNFKFYELDNAHTFSNLDLIFHLLREEGAKYFNLSFSPWVLTSIIRWIVRQDERSLNELFTDFTVNDHEMPENGMSRSDAWNNHVRELLLKISKKVTWSELLK